MKRLQFLWRKTWDKYKVLLTKGAFFFLIKLSERNCFPRHKGAAVLSQQVTLRIRHNSCLFSHFSFPLYPPQAHFSINSLFHLMRLTACPPLHTERAQLPAGLDPPCCQLSTHHCSSRVAAEFWAGACVAEKGRFLTSSSTNTSLPSERLHMAA